jgi:hypothetical protein
LRILSDGEDGLRGVVGTWFGKKCQHRLDWFHVARRIARIGKEYLPYGDDFQERLAAHWANLNSMKWMLWNDCVDMAEFGMTRVRIGLFQHALAHPEANSERFESVEAKLDELRSYLYANRESVRGYAEAYRNGERISTAHVESTVNQLINWRAAVFAYLEGQPVVGLWGGYANAARTQLWEQHSAEHWLAHRGSRPSL